MMTIDAIDLVMDGKVAVLQLKCGTKLTLSPQTSNYWYNGQFVQRVTGVVVYAEDPLFFAGTEPDNQNSKTMSFFIAIEALPMLSALAGGLSRKVRRQEKAYKVAFGR